MIKFRLPNFSIEICFKKTVSETNNQLSCDIPTVEGELICHSSAVYIDPLMFSCHDI